MRGRDVATAALLVGLTAGTAGAQALRWRSTESDGDKPRYEVVAGISARLTGFVDAYGMQSSSTFNFASILPPDRPNREDTRLSADMRSTRLSLGLTARPEGFGEIRSYVETDFWGPSDSLAMRLRKAWVESHGILAGQELTSFGDLQAGPTTADADGPPTGIWTRSVMLRAAGRLVGQQRFMVALESPKADVTYLPEQAPEVEAAYERLPDLAANVSRTGGWGHVQLSGIVRELRYRAAAGTRSATGAGIAASGTLRLFRSEAKADVLYYQGVFGHGIGRYLTSLSGLAADAIPDFKGGLVALPAYGGYLAYERRWTPRLASTAVVGAMRLVNDGVVPGANFLDGRLVMVNTFLALAPGLRLGAEADWARRQDRDRVRTKALRFTVLGRYDF